jgi:hypothetical protein
MLPYTAGTAVKANVSGCIELARAAVGHDRVGLRRLDAATVALVVERPPQVGTPSLGCLHLAALLTPQYTDACLASCQLWTT